MERMSLGEEWRRCEYVRRGVLGCCTNYAKPDSKYCIWHEQVDGKELHGKVVNKGQDLSEAYLEGAKLGGSTLQQVDLSHANLRKADLSFANLEEADLRFADVEGGNLCGANLRCALLDGAKLQKVDLSRARLQGAILDSANLREANLTFANLQIAYLGRTNLDQAKLGDAHLVGAELSHASLHNVILQGCELHGSKLKNARRPITVMEDGRPFRDIVDDHRILKNYFRVEGYYNDVSEHYYKEREFTTKALRKERKWGSWFKDKAQELLCGYGERPSRTVGFSFFLMFLYFVIFSIFGMSIDQALLFSVLSFTTLGYGVSITGSTPLQLVAASEALLGIFMMALLAFTFTRKVER